MSEPDGTEFELKAITADGVDEALDKAERYRLLNEPEEAESICRDVLAVDPDNARNLVTLILSIADQLAGHGRASRKEAYELASRLPSEYERHYYAGIVTERSAKALLDRGPASSFAYDSFREAMEQFERAEAIRPAGNDDAILRWNHCVRTIRRHRLRPRPDDDEQHQLE